MVLCNNNGVPKCESPIEWRLYNALIRKGYKAYTQVKCGPYYIDMVIGDIAIECDGKDFHSSPAQKKYDRKRSAYLYRHGYRSVLRFTGSEINTNVNKCADKIVRAVEKCR
jgi:very-short-patch-repair endonuclease